LRFAARLELSNCMFYGEKEHLQNKGTDRHDKGLPSQGHLQITKRGSFCCGEEANRKRKRGELDKGKGKAAFRPNASRRKEKDVKETKEDSSLKEVFQFHQEE